MYKRTLFLLLCLVIMGVSSPVPASTTSISPDAIQQVLLRLPWSYADKNRESLDARSERAKIMAKALYDAAKEVDSSFNKKWLMGATISIWWHETRFSLEAHEGGLTRWGSDIGKAKCFGQLHERSVGIKRGSDELLTDFRLRQKQAWEALVGTDYEATKRCAISTMRQFAGKLGRCIQVKSTWDARWIGAFGDYGTGGDQCRPARTSKDRFELMKKLVPALQR